MKRKIISVLLTTAMLASMLATMFTPTAASVTVPVYSCGDVDGNGTIAIADALEILKCLAKMNSAVTSGGDRALKAATFQSKGATPAISDVLEILKLLAKMNSYFSTHDLANCSQCDGGGDTNTSTTSSTATTSAASTNSGGTSGSTASGTSGSTTSGTSGSTTSGISGTSGTSVSTTSGTSGSTISGDSNTSGTSGTSVSTTSGTSGSTISGETQSSTTSGTSGTSVSTTSDTSGTSGTSGSTTSGDSNTSETSSTSGDSNTSETSATSDSDTTASGTTGTSESATSSETGNNNNRFQITFNLNYAGSPTGIVVETNGLGRINSANFPANPVRSGFTFTGWFDTSESSGGNRIMPGSSDGTLFTSDSTVYARWVEEGVIVGTPNVIYNMATDRNIHLYGGNPNNTSSAIAASVHPLLKSNGGVRITNILEPPFTIEISGRGGTSQGIDILLSGLNTKAGHSYVFEATGKVTTGTGTQSVWINAISGALNVAGTNSGASLATASVPVNADFTLTTGAISHDVIASNISNEILRYRVGGASQAELLITGLTITAYCPSSCSGCTITTSLPPVVHTPFRNISAATLVNEIGIGWNLGNTLDAHSSSNPAAPSAALQDFNNPSAVETVWNTDRRFRTTQELISAVKGAGFNSIRIPVTWYKATGSAPNYVIDPRWMEHVQSIVDMAVREDMYIILNTHHEEYIMRPNSSAEAAAGRQAVTALWTQIANRFKDYNEKLIFEGLNEPKARTNQWDTSAPGQSPQWNWTGSTALYGVVNDW
ncbi:MAG: cellulase family glycosylhydrolase, partial [Oscillospiraceae bacterium]|nr:cellulase family glycosylhydrolase [Oscillospiraceae bacterium]